MFYRVGSRTPSGTRGRSEATGLEASSTGIPAIYKQRRQPDTHRFMPGPTDLLPDGQRLSLLNGVGRLRDHPLRSDWLFSCIMGLTLFLVPWAIFCHGHQRVRPVPDVPGFGIP